MNHVAPQASVTDLSPDVAAKIVGVEREFQRIQHVARTSQRWFLLGLIPRIVQGISICCLALAVFFVVFADYHPTGATSAVDSARWDIVVRFFSNIIGCGITLLIATWAHRYCEAKADGKL